MDNEKPKTSKAQQQSVNRYINRNYDRVNLTLPKGTKKIIQNYAKDRGMSLNRYVFDLICADMGDALVGDIRK